MSIEQFLDPEAYIDFVVLLGGKVLEKANGQPIEVITDDEGVKFFRFLWRSPLADDSQYYESHAELLTIRADQVVGFSEQAEF